MSTRAKSFMEVTTGQGADAPLENLGVHVLLILGLPGDGICGLEMLGEVDAAGDFDLTARSGIETQPGIRLSALGQDEHDGPVTGAKYAAKRFLVRTAGLG